MQFPALTLKLALKYLKGLEQVVEISNRWAEKAKEVKQESWGEICFHQCIKRKPMDRCHGIGISSSEFRATVEGTEGTHHCSSFTHSMMEA